MPKNVILAASLPAAADKLFDMSRRRVPCRDYRSARDHRATRWRTVPCF